MARTPEILPPAAAAGATAMSARCSCSSPWSPAGAGSGSMPPARPKTMVDGWRAREAKAGRVYSCGTQSIGGYPFRIEVECDKAAAVFRNKETPFELKTAHILAAVQVYDPTLMISEFTGPLTVADARPCAGIRRQLEADAVERARHARGAGARLDRARLSASRSRCRRRAAERAHRQAPRAARPHRRRHGYAQSGDRDGAAPCRRFGAGPWFRGGAADRRRHHRRAARP